MYHVCFFFNFFLPEYGFASKYSKEQRDNMILLKNVCGILCLKPGVPYTNYYVLLKTTILGMLSLRSRKNREEKTLVQ